MTANLTQIKGASKHNVLQRALDSTSVNVQRNLQPSLNGISRVCPIIIFRGKRKRISHKEQDSWDCRLHVAFQKERAVKKWINEQ